MTPGIRGCWEGPLRALNSYAMVNLALTGALIRAGRCELTLLGDDADAPGGEDADAHEDLVSKRVRARLSGPAMFHVRHTWPPTFRPPPRGRWVLIQPWEFGRIPVSWVEPIRHDVDEVWVPSRYVKGCYLDSGIPPEKVWVVPNGVRTDRFGPTAPPLRLATERRFRFLFVGGAIPRKGIDVLLRAYLRAFRRDDDVCLVIKGFGERTLYQGQTLSDEIRRLQRHPRAPEILFLSEDLPARDVAGLYTACDCLVHPYRGEGFGLPVLEAMACGLPVIVTRGGACDDFCAEDRVFYIPAERREVRFELPTAGPPWLLEPDGEALVARMRWVVANASEAREVGRRARDHAHQHMSWSAAADRALQRLEVLCASPSNT